MFFQQIYDKSLSQASYFIGCQATKEAIVIDAKRDVDTYIAIAKQQNMCITHVTETHIHADFLSGTRELAALTGAEIYLSDEGGADWQYNFPHTGLFEGNFIKVGNLSLEVMHTPGHTPESISLLLRDHPATDEPVMIFTGDFVFVGDIGRPDLLEEAVGLLGAKEAGAAQMFSSLKKFMALPDFVQVWPGHGAGSACGKALGAVPSSTVGYERIRNWAFQFGDDYDAFQQELLRNQPEAPYYFAKMKQLNRNERPLLTTIPTHPIVEISSINLEEDGTALIDARPRAAFVAGHLKGALHMQHNNAMATWAGWFLSYSDKLFIVAETSEQEEITRKFMRIGLDNIAGFITDLPTSDLVPSKLIDFKEVALSKDQSDAMLIDVRSKSEFNRSHIPAAKHLFVGHLPKTDLSHLVNKKLIIQCQSGDRASLAYSFLESEGFTNLSLYQGSLNEWMANGGKSISVDEEKA